MSAFDQLEELATRRTALLSVPVLDLDALRTLIADYAAAGMFANADNLRERLWHYEHKDTVVEAA